MIHPTVFRSAGGSPAFSPVNANRRAACSTVLRCLALCLCLLMATGCGKKGDVPSDVGPLETGASHAPVSASGVDPDEQLLSDLEQARLKLESMQSERRDLLIRYRTEQETHEADLKLKLSDAGLAIEEAVKVLNNPASERDPKYAELVGLYKRSARRRVSVVRLEKVIAQDRGDITQLEARVDDLMQKRELKQAISQADRDAARKVLDRARSEAEQRERDELQNPEQVDELNTAFTALKESLKRRVSLLPKRTESKLSDLPALPKLEFEPADLVEKVLLEALHDELAAGTKKAEAALTKQQVDTAIAELQKTFATIRKELDAFKKTPSWKGKCEQELDAASLALSEQLATPYVTALEQAIPTARRQKDWAPVLSLLEELIRVAPKAKQLPELMDTVQTLLAWRVESGDIEARVAAERFNQLQEQLRRPKLDVGVTPKPARAVTKIPTTKPSGSGSSGQFTAPGAVMSGPVNLTAWLQAQEALIGAAQAHRALQADLKHQQDARRKLLETKFETSQEVRKHDATIATAQSKVTQQLEVVRQRLADRDRADKVVFDGIAQHISDLQRDYKRLTDPNGEGERPESAKAKAALAKVAAAEQQQAPFAPGAERAQGRGTAVDLAKVVMWLAFAGSTPGELLVVRNKNIDYRFHWCPAGSFKIGSPSNESGRGSDENQVGVTLSHGFWMLETEVTQGMWIAVMGSSFDWSDKGRSANHPVYNVSHTEAVEFCKKLTTLLRESGELPPDWSITLPTEAQWEYAARAGTTTRFYWGDSDRQVSDYAWYDGNANSSTHPVGQKKRNAWGLHDMSANVWEWCSDWYDSKLAGGMDPQGPNNGEYRVLRGGSWSDDFRYLRSALRSFGTPSLRDLDFGFRVVCVSAPRT